MRVLFEILKRMERFDQRVSMQVSDFVGRILFPRELEWRRQYKVRFFFGAFSALSIILIVFVLGLVLMLKTTDENQIDTTPSISQSPLSP